MHPELRCMLKHKEIYKLILKQRINIYYSIFKSDRIKYLNIRALKKIKNDLHLNQSSTVVANFIQLYKIACRLIID